MRGLQARSVRVQRRPASSPRTWAPTSRSTSIPRSIRARLGRAFELHVARRPGLVPRRGGSHAARWTSRSSSRRSPRVPAAGPACRATATWTSAVYSTSTARSSPAGDPSFGGNDGGGVRQLKSTPTEQRAHSHPRRAGPDLLPARVRRRRAVDRRQQLHADDHQRAGAGAVRYRAGRQPGLRRCDGRRHGGQLQLHAAARHLRPVADQRLLHRQGDHVHHRRPGRPDRGR